MHNGVTSHLWLKSALHASSHPCMCTCVLRLGFFLLACLCSLLRPTVLLPALPDVYLRVQREVQVQPLCDFRLGTAVTSDYETPLTESEGSLPQPHDSFPDAGEAIHDFWSMSGNFIYRHHVEPRVKLYSPREESFPIPLKYIDVTRTTLSNLDVKQEKRIDDYWNIDGSRDLSDPWTGFTQFTLLDEKPPDGYTWSGGRLTRKQLTSRPDHLWPELWKSMGKHAKLKEKQTWSEEKFHLENARKLRGI